MRATLERKQTSTPVQNAFFSMGRIIAKFLPEGEKPYFE